MEHVSYGKWVMYLKRRIEELGVLPKTLLDVACGTGTPTMMLSKEGFFMVGVDKSVDMVRLARCKALDARIHIPFFVQDMRYLTLKVPVNVVLCLYDSVNFLLRDDDVGEAFQSAYRILDVGGLYIFDVVTEQNIRSFFDGQVYRGKTNRYSYRWTNEYDPKSRICLSHLTGSCMMDGSYQRFHEVHRERIYPAYQIQSFLEDVGFQILAVRDAFTNKPQTHKSHRIHFECVKR